MEKIEFVIRETIQANAAGAHHAYLRYTDQHGTKFHISFGQFHDASSAYVFGRLGLETGEQRYSKIDRSEYADKDTKFLMTSGDLSHEWRNLINLAERIDFENIPYNPFGTNSNAAITTLIRMANLQLNEYHGDTSIPFAPGLWAPGQHIDLRNLYNLYDDVPAFTIDRMFQRLSVQPDYYDGFVGHLYRGADDGVRGTPSGSGSWQRVIEGEFDHATEEFKVTYQGFDFVPEVRFGRIPPIVIDLDQDGLELLSPFRSPGFDFDGNGFITSMGWFTGGDALLAEDLNGNGRIDGENEISFLSRLPGAKTDLEALRAYDANGDGQLSAADPKFAALRLWRDANLNGASEASELVTLQSAGVVSLGLGVTAAPQTIEGNIVHGFSLVTFGDGRIARAYDVELATALKGSKLIQQDSTWRVGQYDTGEYIAMAVHNPGEHAYGAMFGDITLHTIGDMQPTSYLFANGKDYIRHGSWTEYSAPYFIDSGAGDDKVDMAASFNFATLQGGSGNDTLLGSMFDDNLSGGYGNDILSGGRGSDSYLVGRQSGADIIAEDGSAYGISDQPGGDDDYIIFDGINRSETTVTQSGSDLILSGPSGWSVRIVGHAQAATRIEWFVFSDGVFDWVHL
jgi:hypothetical protein